MTDKQLKDMGFVEGRNRTFMHKAISYDVWFHIPKKTTTNDLFHMIYSEGFKNGMSAGKNILADELKSLLQIEQP